jgi:hypothetical protein
MLTAVRKNTPLLASLDLITARPPILMKSADGTILEVFEWVSALAKRKAHKNQEVMALWTRMMELGKNVTLKTVTESGDVFANFKPI